MTLYGPLVFGVLARTRIDRNGGKRVLPRVLPNQAATATSEQQKDFVTQHCKCKYWPWHFGIFELIKNVPFVFKNPKIRLGVLGMIHGHLTHLHLPYFSQAAGVSPLFLYTFLHSDLSLSLGVLLCLSFNSRKIHLHLTFIYSSSTLLVPLTSIPVSNNNLFNKKWDFIGRNLLGK